MSLTVPDLYSRETLVRAHADRLRTDWPESIMSDMTVSTEAKITAKRKRQEADHLDQVADLLVGLQGDWSGIGPMVRRGFLAVMRSFDEQKPAAETSSQEHAV